MQSSRFDVLVLGAGMVGSSTAAQLALRGARVALVDRRAPGEETSFGNSGFMDAAAFMPHVMPRDLATLIARARGVTPHVNLHLAMLPRLLGWLGMYWRESTPERVLAAAARLAPLAAHSVTEHKALATEAGSRALIRDTGVLRGYRLRKTFEQGAWDRDLLRRYGIEIRELDTAQLTELEPCLSPVMERALWHPNACFSVDPGGLTKSYAGLVSRGGGAFIEGDAATLAKSAQGWSVSTSQGVLQAPQVVVALGPWAKDLLAGFGVKVPIAVKRGYHMHYSLKGNATLTRPISESETGYVLSPMAMGVRLTTGAEFADRDAPPTPVQLAACEPVARQVVPLDQRLQPKPWMGARPCSPDSTPIIDAMPGNSGMWFAGGHGHWGFGLGAVTGRLVAELVSGTTPIVDPKPFSLARFA
jgi:D-amino-acid dehydrogenase